MIAIKEENEKNTLEVWHSLFHEEEYCNDISFGEKVNTLKIHFCNCIHLSVAIIHARILDTLELELISIDVRIPFTNPCSMTLTLCRQEEAGQD